MLRNTVVPNHDGTLLPLDADVEVSTPGKMLVEEVENGVGFFFLKADNIAGDCSC